MTLDFRQAVYQRSLANRDRSTQITDAAPAAGSPRHGDLYVFSEAGDYPGVWAIIDSDSGRFLILPADVSPMVGSSDIAVAATSSAGALTLRCRYGLWLSADAFASDRRTGSLEPETIARAQRQIAAGQRGPASASSRQQDTDAELEYLDLQEEIEAAVDGLRAAYPQRPQELAGIGESGRWRPWSQRPLGNPYAIAASALLAVTLASSGALVWQSQRLERIEQQLVTTEQTHLRELQELRERSQTQAQDREASRQTLSQLQQDRQQLEQRYRQEVAELRQRLDRAQRQQPLVHVPLAWLTPGTERQRALRQGEIEALEIPAAATHVALFLEISKTAMRDVYWAEIEALATGDTIWSGEVAQTGTAELLIVLPRDMLAAGDYLVELRALPERVEVVGEYAFRLAEPSSSLSGH